MPWIALGFGVVVGVVADFIWLMAWWSPNHFESGNYPLGFAGPVATVGLIVPVLTSLVFFRFVGSEKMRESLFNGLLYGAGAGALAGLFTGLTGDSFYRHIHGGVAIGDAILNSLGELEFFVYFFARHVVQPEFGRL